MKKKTMNRSITRKKIPFLFQWKQQIVCCLFIAAVFLFAGHFSFEPVQFFYQRVTDYSAIDYEVPKLFQEAKKTAFTVLSAAVEPKFTLPCNESPIVSVSAEEEGNEAYFFTAEKEIQVHAGYGGTIKEISGNKIVISHGNNIESIYSGCSMIYVSQLQKVRKGDLIASVNAPESELKFQILKKQQPVDIRDYVEIH